jgi:iron complex transport system substrate-binding protein
MQKKKKPNVNKANSKCTEYASGFLLLGYEGYSVVSVSNPWPEANKNFTYILKKKKRQHSIVIKYNSIISSKPAPPLTTINLL